MEELERKLRQWMEENRAGSPIVVENLNIEHLEVHKMEHNNSFGALGIKELKGRLNIGANYGTSAGAEGLLNDMLSDEEDSESETSCEPGAARDGPSASNKSRQGKPAAETESPRVRIRPRGGSV